MDRFSDGRNNFEPSDSDFDSDQAGAGAALRGDTLRTPVDLDFDLRVADLPGGMDPADLVQAGRNDDLAKAITDSRPLLQFRIEKEVRRHAIFWLGQSKDPRAIDFFADILK